MAGRCSSRVEGALRGIAADVERTGIGTWDFSLVHGAVVPARARIADDWLELTTAIPESTRLPLDPLAWLQLNAQLVGPVRAARAFRAAEVHLRTDVSLESDASLTECVGFACGQLRNALHLLQPESGEMLLVPRSDRRLEIETRAGVFGAHLELAGDAERVVVESVNLTDRPATCHRAVAMFLLALSSVMRAVKGLVRERDGARVAALASGVEGAAPQAVDRSLSAMAVACELSGREVQALCDERLAHEYLALWGSAPRHDSHNTEEEYICLQQL